MKSPDFKAQEAMLVEASIASIGEFAKENRGVLFQQFAFDCNPNYGEVLLCLDNKESSDQFAREHERYLTQRRDENTSYDDPHLLPWATSTVEYSAMPMVPFNNNVGDYSHQGFAEFTLEAWSDFRASDAYPGEFESSGDDYLAAIASVLLSRAADELVSRNAFADLKCSSPFLVGFQLHDQSHHLVRMINW